MRRFIFLLYAVAATLALHAQNDEEQVLVFRHSGEVNLFYASQLDRIELSSYDANGVLHDEVVSQVFYAEDTTMVVPIAEIDSVAFGSRNRTVLNKAVRQLNDDIDMPWILRAEGNHLYYRENTPVSVLPKVGEKLYYAETSELMPAGLAAKVASVAIVNNEMDVVLEDVDLNEIFDELFYAGRIITSDTETKAQKNSRRKASEKPSIPENYTEPVSLEGTLELERFGEIEVKGETDITADFVVNVRQHYYHAHVRGETGVGFDWTLQSEDSGHETYSTPQIRIPLPVIAGVLHPVIYANLFCDLTAELRFKYSMRRNYVFEYEWTRQNGKNTVENRTPTGEDQQGQDVAKADLLLDGEVFVGAELGVELNLTGDRVGVRCGVKAGPFLSGEFGLGVLRELREYNPELYHRAQIDFGVKANVRIAAFDHEFFWIFGNEVEHSLYEHDFTLFQHTVNLFPHFEQTRGVEATTQTETEVTVATHVEDEIVHELEMGFEILDETGEILDSVYVEDLIEPDMEDVQGFESSFILPKRTDPDAQPLRVRPVFHYVGYPIAYKDVDVLHDSHIMPITAYGTNGVATFISGASMVGIFKTESTTYHIGNYLPIPQRDPVFMPGWGIEPKTPGKTIDGDAENTLFGTWTGTVDGDLVTLTFNDDEGRIGTYIVGGNNHNFTYDFNNPQSGDVRLLLDDNHVIIFTIVSVNDTTLVIHKKGNMEQYILNKLY